jgi:hypothetical protein
MSELPVDPDLFRLRSFEASWLGELDEREAELSANLRFVLAMEAERWRAIGREIEYFSDADGFEVERVSGFPEELYFHDSTLPDESTFVSMLRAARGDRTPERLAFLDLFVFAGDERWEAALDTVMEVAALGDARTWVPLPPEQVAAIAWSLDGAEPPSDTPREYAVYQQDPEDAGVFISPAAWRIELPLSDRFAPMPPSRFAIRARELRVARAGMRRLAETIIARDLAVAGAATIEPLPWRLLSFPQIQRLAEGFSEFEGGPRRQIGEQASGDPADEE